MFGMMADEMLNGPELTDPGLTDEEKAERLAQLSDLIEMVRPIIQQDGGDLVLLSADVSSGVIELQLQGACSSCAISATTLQAGVERILRDRLDWVTEITSGVDEEMDWQESASMGRGAYVPKW
jgi:Fe-S cluster biogenesis protein NfuA